MASELEVGAGGAGSELAVEVGELEVGPELEGLAIEACAFSYLTPGPGLP
jgi:hypothetical protein